MVFSKEPLHNGQQINLRGLMPILELSTIFSISFILPAKRAQTYQFLLFITSLFL